MKLFDTQSNNQAAQGCTDPSYVLILFVTHTNFFLCNCLVLGRGVMVMYALT